MRGFILITSEAFFTKLKLKLVSFKCRHAVQQSFNAKRFKMPLVVIIVD